VKRFIQGWLINTLAVLVAVYIVPGIHYRTWLDLLVASLLFGIFNAVLRPILMFLSLPLLLVTLGLFTLVINGVVLFLVGAVLRPHFYVDRFWDAFWGALIISVISMILNVLTGHGSSQSRGRPPQNPKSGGGGPVIDV
jgi:putative membrane protein